MIIFEIYGELIKARAAAHQLESFVEFIYSRITPELEEQLKYPLDRGLAEFIKDLQDKVTPLMEIK